MLLCGPALFAGVDSDREAARIQTIERVKGTVVSIFGQTADGGGSGVLISPDGLALTNFHVVSGAGVAMRCGLDDGELYDAVLVGVDPVGDVALIKLLGRNDFPVATLGDSNKLAVGQPVLAMGNPFLLATDFQPSVSLGIVSGVHRYQHPAQSQKGSLLEYADCIQTDASINPGNSGGPLFNLDGEVVGVNGRISLDKRGRVNVGVGYAISINQIKNFLEHLKGGLIVDHARLGATVAAAADGRTLVDDIDAESDAYRQGLRVGDEIVSFGGRVVTSPNDFLNVQGIYPKGWRLELVFRRNQERHTIRPRLLGKHRDRQLADILARPQNSNQQEEPKLPDAVAAVYEERRGFANYHFNRLYRDQLLSIVQGQKADGRRGQWTAILEADPHGEATVRVRDGAASWKLGEARIEFPGSEQPADPAVVSFLAALEEWRRMLVDQANWFSECDFAGGFRDENGRILLGLRTTRAGGETLWLFQTDEPSLQQVVLRPSGKEGWVQLGLKDYSATPTGAVLPQRLSMELPGQAVREYRVKSWEVAP